MTFESYQAGWAQDPYDPTYNGVDRRTLCYMSDDERYDDAFAGHPLSKVRRLLREIPGHAVVIPAPVASASHARPRPARA